MRDTRESYSLYSEADTVPLTDVTISESDGRGWDDFVRSRPNGSFYHQFDWQEVNQQALGHRCIYLVARLRDGSLAGVLPLVLVSSCLFGRILCSVPFVNFGGPVAIDRHVETALVQRAIRLAQHLGCRCLELRCAETLHTSIPPLLHKVCFRVRLDGDPLALWNSFSRKHRHNIRRAQKNDLVVDKGGIDLVPDLYRILELSWRNLGTPLYRQAYFETIASTFGSRITIYRCRYGNRVVAAALVGELNGTIEGMWAGVDPSLRHLQANYVLYWEMLRDACQLGHACFNLGRSTADSGGEQFKSKWNAETQQLFWYLHSPSSAPTPDLSVTNPTFKVAMAAWRRLPLSITRIVGPRIARLIP